MILHAPSPFISVTVYSDISLMNDNSAISSKARKLIGIPLQDVLSPLRTSVSPTLIQIPLLKYYACSIIMGSSSAIEKLHVFRNLK